MLKALIIGMSTLIALVSVSAQPAGSPRRHSLRKAGVVRVGPSTTYLKEGFSLAEVIRLLGEPTASSKQRAGNQSVMTYEFQRGPNRVLIGEFVNGALVGSRIEIREQLALGHRLLRY